MADSDMQAALKKAATKGPATRKSSSGGSERTSLLNVHAPRSLVLKVKKKALDRDTTMKAIVIEALEEWLEHHG